jgi:hypothetical protein
MEIEVPDYNNGLHMVWDPGFEIRAVVEGGGIHILANRAGLISLARLMLTLADVRVPKGSHWHLDPTPVGELEPESVSLIIGREASLRLA